MKLFVARHGETDGNVNELACGIWESELTEKGRRQAQALAERLKDEQAKNPFLQFPGGESLTHVAHRAYSIIEEIKAKPQTGNVLFVCHGVFITMAQTYFKSLSMEEFFHLEISNCQLLNFDL